MNENMKNNLELCINYTISRSQRENEVARGQGLEGTQGYEIAGCYSCKGYNTSCEFYTSNYEAFGDAVEDYLGGSQ